MWHLKKIKKEERNQKNNLNWSGFVHKKGCSVYKNRGVRFVNGVFGL